MKKNQKNRIGFTLIELILVLGLVTTLGALAAPQFTDVFDHSKDQADIAQMDQILAAFQLEQAPFYEGHDGDYDLLKAENVSYVREGGKIVDTIVDPDQAEKTLQAFLNNVVKPGSDVYMEGAKCVKTEKTHVIKGGKQISVFEAKLNKEKTGLKIVCRADKNESSIELPLPGLNKPIDDVYSDGEMINGTWMIIGDDDRLRADYVEDYLKKDDKTKKKLDEELKKDQTYRFKTTFRIETEMEDKEEKLPLMENMDPDDKWITWIPTEVNSVHKIKVKKSAISELEGVTVKMRLNDGPFEELDSVDGLNKTIENNSSGTKNLDRVIFEFSKIGEKTKYLPYDVSLVQMNKLNTFKDHNAFGSDVDIFNVIYSDQDNLPGLLYAEEHGGNPHILYYQYSLDSSGTDGAGNSGSGTSIVESIHRPTTDFYTGFVFNIVQSDDDREEKEYHNYDFLAIHYNESKKITELLYLEKKGNGKTVTQIGEGIELVDFQYNHNYTIELNVTDEKAVNVTLYDETKTLLNSRKIVKVNNSLHPAIGYYMNQTVELQKKKDPKLSEKAVAGIDEEKKINQIPLVTYEDDPSIGPRLVIVTRPEFYPYETEVIPPDAGSGENQGSGNGDENGDDGGGVLVTYAMPSISPYTNNPENPYTVEPKTEGNDVEYTWVQGLENDSIDHVDWNNRVLQLEEGESGWLWVRECNGNEVAPEDQWAKKPWVNTNSIIWNERGETQEKTISISGVELPVGSLWKFIQGSLEANNSITINVPVNQNVEVSAYVGWVNQDGEVQQVSEEQSHVFTYQEEKLIVEVLVLPGKNAQFRGIQIKATGKCKVEYELLNKDNRVQVSGFEDIAESMIGSNITLVSDTNEVNAKITVNDNLGVVVTEKTIPIVNGVYIWNSEKWVK